MNLTVQPGEWLGLVGANGSGKSTLLRLLSRLLPPQTGAVLLAGRDLHTLSPTAIARQLALLPQQQTLPDGLTVEQLVSLGRSPHQPWWQWEMDSAGRQQVHQALAWTALTEFRDRPVADLSGGERQRAFLALALAQNPQVLLLDEPTTFLDIHYQLQILDLLKGYQSAAASLYRDGAARHQLGSSILRSPSAAATGTNLGDGYPPSSAYGREFAGGVSGRSLDIFDPHGLQIVPTTPSSSAISAV